MSAKASLAAARRRRGPQPQSAQMNITQNKPAAPSAPTGKLSQANINQYMVFLNNKIETVEKRVSESLKNSEDKITEEIKKLNAVDLSLIEQTVEAQKLKISKLSSLLNDLQHNYLQLNTSLLSVKEEIKPIMSVTSVESGLKVVPISEDCEEHWFDKEKEEEETESEQLAQEPEPEIETEEQNITQEILEKND